MKKTVKEIKDSWLLAKLKCDDHKGIGAHRFSIASRLGINQMQVAFGALAPKEHGRHETFVDLSCADGTGDDTYYRIGDLIADLKKYYTGKTITLSFRYNIWNKWGTDTINVVNLFEKEFTIS